MNFIKKTITERPFPQIPLMSEHGFASFLRDRGIDVGVNGVRSFVQSGLIEKLDAPSGDFHPFQIWPINKLFQEMDLRLEAGIRLVGTDPTRLTNFINQNWKQQVEHLTNFPKSDACLQFNRQIFPLLLWLESYFLPIVLGPRPGVITLVNADLLEWNQWRRRTEVKDWLSKHSVSVEELSNWRRNTLFDASFNDPAQNLYLLLRSMPFGQRRQFKGHIRLSYDLYEMAEIVRLVLEQISEQPQVKEWDPTGHPSTPWVERVYGSQPQFGSPKFLRPVVRHFGLDPAFRIQWLVEGPTEKGFIVQYAKRFGANIQEFVDILVFGGDGNLSRRSAAIDAQLEFAGREQCFVTLTFDDSPSVRNRVDGLIKDRLVNLRYVLNRPDFELENFTIEQLIAVSLNWATYLSKSVKLTQQTLVREVSSQSNNKGFEKALNDTLRSKNEQYRLSKGEEWGKRLADHLMDTRDSEWAAGTYSEQALSKIEKQVLYIIQNSQPDIDYPKSMENFDSASLEIR